MFEHFLSGMIGCEASMIRRMPVLRSHNERKRRLNSIDDRNDRIPMWNSECATRQKIVLNIN